MASPLWLSMLYRGGGMPGAGGAPASTPQTGLLLSQLLAQYQEPEMPVEPTYPGSLRDLDPERRRDLRIQSLLATLGAGLAAPPGQFGTGALGGALQGREAERLAVEQERATLREQWEAKKRGVQEQAVLARQRQAQEEERLQAEGILQTYQQVEAVAQGHPDIVGEARAAALAQDRNGLQKVLQEAPARVAYRKALEAAGVDWRNPLAVQAHETTTEQEADIAKTVATHEALRERRLSPYEPPAPPQAREPYYQMVVGGDGNFYVYDPRNPIAAPVPLAIPGKPPSTEKTDPDWVRAEQQAQAEALRALVPTPADPQALQRRAAEIYQVLKSQPPAGGPAAQPAAPVASPAPGIQPPIRPTGIGASAEPPAAVVSQVARDLRTTPEAQVLAELRKDFPPAMAAMILATAKARLLGAP